MKRAVIAAVLAAGMLSPMRGQPAQEVRAGMEITKPSDTSIVLKRSFAAPRQKVFEAMTDPSHLPQWFRPEQMKLVSYETDLRTGGSYRCVFERPNGKRIELRGQYQKVDAPRGWTHVESYDFSPLTLRVTTVLEEAGGKTVMTQTMQYASKEDRDGDYEGVASSAEIYVKLDEYLKSLKVSG